MERQDITMSLCDYELFLRIIFYKKLKGLILYRHREIKGLMSINIGKNMNTGLKDNRFMP